MALSTHTVLLTSADICAVATRERRDSDAASPVTAILRFVPDILEESSAVRDAQSCRGFKPSSNPFRRIFDYMMVIKPMVFRSISRSENMALSLQMRGFSSPKPRVFIIDTKLRDIDYISMILFLIILSLLFYFI